MILVLIIDKIVEYICDRLSVFALRSSIRGAVYKYPFELMKKLNSTFVRIFIFHVMIYHMFKSKRSVIDIKVVE